VKVVYVIGPYRAKTVNEILHNIYEARRVAEELWRKGYAVICPHLNSAFMDGHVPDEVFLKADQEILGRCDGFALVRGWERSEGSLDEVRLALMMGKEFVQTRRGVHNVTVDELRRIAWGAKPEKEVD